MTYYEKEFKKLAAIGIDPWYIRLYMIDKIAVGNFPTWDEYKTLFDGDEYDNTASFMNAYDRHREEWLMDRINNIDRTY